MMLEYQESPYWIFNVVLHFHPKEMLLKNVDIHEGQIYNYRF